MDETEHDRERRAVLAAAAGAAILLSNAQQASAQTTPVGIQVPVLKLALTAYVKIAALEAIGEIPGGQGRMIPITGGEFEGPRLKGLVVPGGADWQTVRPDGVTELRAHYGLKTDDGALIQVQNHVLARMEPAAAGAQPQRILRGTIEFIAPKGPHDWLNKTVFVSTLNAPGDPRAPVVIRAFEAV